MVSIGNYIFYRSNSHRQAPERLPHPAKRQVRLMIRGSLLRIYMLDNKPFLCIPNNKQNEVTLYV